jgi:hypothetical protein
MGEAQRLAALDDVWMDEPICCLSAAKHPDQSRRRRTRRTQGMVGATPGPRAPPRRRVGFIRPRTLSIRSTMTSAGYSPSGSPSQPATPACGRRSVPICHTSCTSLGDLVTLTAGDALGLPPRLTASWAASGRDAGVGVPAQRSEANGLLRRVKGARCAPLRRGDWSIAWKSTTAV